MPRFRHALIAALAALALHPLAASAADTTTASSLALASPTVTSALVTALVPAGSECPAPVTLALVHTPAAPELLGVHYRSRGRGYARRPEASGVSQVHVGFFDPDGDQGSRLDIGVRGGPMIDRNLQLGLGVDWIHKTENQSSVTTVDIGPGGVPIQVKQDLSRASMHTFPIMAFAQISGNDDMGVIPYFGVAGGYQVMVLSADDFATGQSFEGTFSGWGWQLWGGAALPLGGRTRLTGEVFVNGAELGRDTNESFTGQTIHETVNNDGMGARFGVAWGF